MLPDPLWQIVRPWSRPAPSVPWTDSPRWTLLGWGPLLLKFARACGVRQAVVRDPGTPFQRITLVKKSLRRALIEQQQVIEDAVHHAVGHQRRVDPLAFPPLRTPRPPFEERVAVGVEQVAVPGL